MTTTTTMYPLTEFCLDIDTNGELVRCCSCFNTLAMSGNYVIETIENKIIPFLPEEAVEGMVCDRCIGEGRHTEKAVLICGEGDVRCVTYVHVYDLETVTP